VQAAHHQAEVGMALAENRKGAQQRIQVLVRVQGGNGQQEALRLAPPGDPEESRVHAMLRHSDLAFRQPVVARQIAAVACEGASSSRETCADQKSKNCQTGRSNQRKFSGCRLCCMSWNMVTCGQGAASGAVNPAFNITFQAAPRRFQRQHGLLPQNPPRKRLGAHRLLRHAKVGPRRPPDRGRSRGW